jgi:hypothetical protein
VYYCTPADVREAAGGTDNGTGSCAQLADDQLQTAIGQASSKVSAYAGTTYEADGSGPVTVPDLIFTVTVQLAVYYATMIYRKNMAFQSALDPVYLMYQDAMGTLQALSSGTISADPSAPDVAPDDAGSGRNTVPRTLTYADAGVVATPFGIEAEGADGSMRGFWPDPG